jgi:hypothetical protein
MSTADRYRVKVDESVATISIKNPYRPTRDVALLSGHASYTTYVEAITRTYSINSYENIICDLHPLFQKRI